MKNLKNFALTLLLTAVGSTMLFDNAFTMKKENKETVIGVNMGILGNRYKHNEHKTAPVRRLIANMLSSNILGTKWYPNKAEKIANSYSQDIIKPITNLIDNLDKKEINLDQTSFNEIIKQAEEKVVKNIFTVYKEDPVYKKNKKEKNLFLDILSTKIEASFLKLQKQAKKLPNKNVLIKHEIMVKCCKNYILEIIKGAKESTKSFFSSIL